MARKPNPPAVVLDPAIDHEAVAKSHSDLNTLSIMNAEAHENAIALAEQVGYSGSLNLDVLESGIAESQGRVAFELFAIGARLLLLKELCSHGEFADRCARVGYEGSVARRLMQATLRLGNRATSHDLERLGKSKLFELLVLDDDELDAITSGGSARGIVMDDADRMSVKELRAAVRGLRSDVSAKDKVLGDTQQRLTKLQVQQHKKVVADTDWPDALSPLAEQIAAAGRQIALSVSALETCRITLFEVAADVPEEGRAKYDAALTHMAEVYAEALQRAERVLAKERLTFDKSLGGFAPEQG